MPDNKGFTLVEMIVSIAIFSILALAVMGFMTTGTRSYADVSATVNLQTQAQQAMAQLQEYLIDCNGGMLCTGDTLYVVNTAPGGDYTTHVFRFDSATQALYYGENRNVSDVASLTSADLMTSYLTGFQVTLPAASRISTATVELSFAFRHAEHNAVQKLSLRNHPLTAASYADLIAACTG